MANPNTYTFDDVLRMNAKLVPRNVIDDHGADICTLAYNKIWQRYDWRESLKTLPPFYLIPGEQEVGPPFYSVPDDFNGLRKVNYVYVQSDPPVRKPLKVIKDLDLTHIKWWPHAICYNPDTRSFRVYSRLADNIGAPLYQIEGSYKVKSPRITPSTLTMPIPTRDDLIQMWIEGVKWAALFFAGNTQQAGMVQYTHNGTAYSGQLANFMVAMEECAMNEGLELGDVNISPSEPLAQTHNGVNLSIFGGWNY